MSLLLDSVCTTVRVCVLSVRVCMHVCVGEGILPFVLPATPRGSCMPPLLSLSIASNLIHC